MLEWTRRAVLPFTDDPPPEFVADADPGDGGGLQAIVYGDGRAGPFNLFVAYLSPKAMELPDSLTPKERGDAVATMVADAGLLLPGLDHLARFPTFDEVRVAVDALLPEGVVMQLPQCVAMGAGQEYAPPLGSATFSMVQVGVVPNTPAAAGAILAPGPGLGLLQ